MGNYLGNRNFYFMVLMDALLVVSCFFLAYLFRFEFQIPEKELASFARTWPYVLIIKMASFFFFRLYKGMWRYTSLVDFVNVVKAIVASSLVLMAGILLVYRFQGYPRSVFIIDGFLTFVAIGGIRVVIRLYFAQKAGVVAFRIGGAQEQAENKKRLLIIGAGDAGEKALRELRDNPRLKYQIVGFIDDDSYKIGRSIHSVPVVDDLSGLKNAVDTLNVQELLIAIPSATGPQMRRIVDVCKGCGIPFKTLPGLGEIIEGKVSVKALRDIDYQDLLGRPSVTLDIENIRSYLEKKRVLITGAGGSIGSELCRQMVRFNPDLIVLFDRSESNLYSIQMELKHNVGYQKYATVLGSVQNGRILESVFKRYQPEVVFHSAAYKHVPILERNPWQAVHNNIKGSQHLLSKCVDHGVGHFVLVSTDKAVRPTNVMGASKRVAEMLLQTYVGNPTRMMAVRFGNVVGSSE